MINCENFKNITFIIIDIINKLAIPIASTFFVYLNYKFQEKKYQNEKKFRLFEKRLTFIEHFKTLQYNLFIKPPINDNLNDKYNYFENIFKELYKVIKNSQYLFNYRNEKFFIENILKNIYELQELEQTIYKNNNSSNDENFKKEIELKNIMLQNCNLLTEILEKYLILED